MTIDEDDAGTGELAERVALQQALDILRRSSHLHARRIGPIDQDPEIGPFPVFETRMRQKHAIIGKLRRRLVHGDVHAASLAKPA